MAYNLQHPPSNRTILQGFRGVTKSFITCAYADWMLWNNPNLKIMIVSASKDRADANAIFIKKIMQTIPFLQKMLPKKGQRDTQNIFDVADAEPDISPSIKSVGVTGQMTGSRADVLIADDVEVQNNSGTQVQREKLGELVKEFDASGQIIYLGTPQNEMSIYNTLERERGYACLIYPILYPQDDKEREFYGDRLGGLLAKNYDSDPQLYRGQPTEPSRFPREEIEARRQSYGKGGFALQFMLNTNLSDFEKYPLKVADLIVSSLDHKETSLKWSWGNNPQSQLKELKCVALKGDYFYSEFDRSKEISKYQGTVMAIDPSGRGKDETAYAIVKFLNGYLFLMEVGGYQEGYSPQTLKAIAAKAKYWEVNEIIYESNYGDGMFGQLFKPILAEIHPCGLDEIKHTKQKELRIIDTLEPILMGHKLIVNAQVIEDDYQMYERDVNKSLVYQMTRLSRDRGALAHDDRLDAVTSPISYWLESMAIDNQRGLEDAWEQELEDMLEYGLMSHKERRGSNYRNLTIHNRSF